MAGDQERLESFVYRLELISAGEMVKTISMARYYVPTTASFLTTLKDSYHIKCFLLRQCID